MRQLRHTLQRRLNNFYNHTHSNPNIHVHVHVRRKTHLASAPCMTNTKFSNAQRSSCTINITRTATTTSTDTGTHMRTDRKRVLGVIAHINSGKTTTTEALLHTSGQLRRMGNVDSGDTTMDYLPTERERGITITAAAISLHWKHHELFLVDSPGHLDFTYEVERALRVMDAAVVVVDCVNGVQSQTETVWRQADKNKLPRLIFVNKLDRLVSGGGGGGGGIDKVLKEMYKELVSNIKNKFHVVPVVLNYPVVEEDGQLTIFNVLDTFSNEQEEGGEKLKIENDYENQVMETCADFNDTVFDDWMNGYKSSKKLLVDTIRKACISNKVIPILCGSSLQQLGTENLLNSIVTYLPSPGSSRSTPEDFVAYAFKVVYDRHRGRLVYMRVYSGSCNAKKLTLFNTTQHGLKETPTKLLKIVADKYVDIESVSAGDIFAVVGMKVTKTGDTLVTVNNASGTVVLDGVCKPPSVFTVAVEPEATAHENDLDDALMKLVDEDDSLELRKDDATADTLLSGMGELHLDVAVEHLKRKLPFDIYVSSPRVAYCESITQPIAPVEIVHTLNDEGEHGDRHHENMDKFRVSIDLINDDENQIDIQECNDENKNQSETKNKSKRKGKSNSNSNSKVVEQLTQGIEAKLGRGEILGLPLKKLHVTCEILNISSSSISSSSSSLYRSIGMYLMDEVFKQCEFCLLEPVLNLSISNVPKICIGEIMSEITHPLKRRGTILDISSSNQKDGDHERNEIKAILPVKGMLGFTTKFRSITKGRGDLQSSFKQYQVIDKTTQQKLLDNDEIF